MHEIIEVDLRSPEWAQYLGAAVDATGRSLMVEDQGGDSLADLESCDTDAESDVLTFLESYMGEPWAAPCECEELDSLVQKCEDANGPIELDSVLDEYETFYDAESEESEAAEPTDPKLDEEEASTTDKKLEPEFRERPNAGVCRLRHGDTRSVYDLQASALI